MMTGVSLSMHMHTWYYWCSILSNVSIYCLYVLHSNSVSTMSNFRSLTSYIYAVLNVDALVWTKIIIGKVWCIIWLSLLLIITIAPLLIDCRAADMSGHVLVSISIIIKIERVVEYQYFIFNVRVAFCKYAYALHKSTICISKFLCFCIFPVCNGLTLADSKLKMIVYVAPWRIRLRKRRKCRCIKNICLWWG